MPTPGSATSTVCSSNELSTKLDTVRRALYRLLPSQADYDILTSYANEWWYLHKFVTPTFKDSKAKDGSPRSWWKLCELGTQQL